MQLAQTRCFGTCSVHHTFISSRTRVSLRPGRPYSVTAAAGDDPLQKAKQAGERLDREEAQLQGQLANMANVEVDGNFAAQELEQAKDRLRQHLKDLDSLKQELKQAVEVEKKE